VIDAAPIAIFHRTRRTPTCTRRSGAPGRQRPAVRRAASLERALLFHPADAQALHLTLAELYGKLGDTGKAAAHRAASR